MYFKNKIDNYKLQDKKAGRQWKEDEYVTLDWILDEWRKLPTKCCPSCRTPFEKYLNEYNQVRTNVTIDRLNNNLSHVKDNSQLLCVNCNVTKR